MSTKWQKFKVDLPKGYIPIERKAIAEDIIRFIRERTRSGKDKNNNNFKPGYTKEYASTREGQLAGKHKGGTPNLKLTGDMLSSLGEYTRTKPNELTIGYNKGSEENAKADGNVRGTYGNSSPVTHGRDFMGITKKDLSGILKNYPRSKGEKALITRLKNVVLNVETRAMAEKIAKSIARKQGVDFDNIRDEVFNEE